ncbi:FliM/FliN family flagellar motor switch protein [Pseudacidobacterium ailaaui]|uniref:FliM/FliN family flagellar motor switch protein n=1 Tax=Pseudacidobacterium ailaaui TaxID=1382359 RepID=UPI001EE27E15|nr:flagellar motor switch protein FliN [Pseudacidobacterium ailaaui]
MKTFLDAWLLEAPPAFSQELAGTVKLVSCTSGLEPQKALCFQAEYRGGLSGTFWIMVEKEKLGGLLKAAHLVSESSDERQGEQIWENILRQVADRAGKAAGRWAGAVVSVVTLRQVPFPAGEAFQSYELCFGEEKVLLGVADKAESQERDNRIPPRGVELLLDVELDASLRFGSREMPLGEVLELGPGDVVQLERHVTDPVDLIVGDKIVARGEVVLVNGNFGLRVTEVAEPRKSLESIRCLF